MREALERVIAELRILINESTKFEGEYRSEGNEYMLGVISGRTTASGIAINLLKEVLNHEGEHESKQHIQSTQTEQIRIEENDR